MEMKEENTPGHECKIYLSSFNVALIKNDVLLPLIFTAQKPSVLKPWSSIMDKIVFNRVVFTKRVCCVYVYIRTDVDGQNCW